MALPAIRARIRVSLQALEVGANVAGVLVAQLAILLETLVDDALELGRDIGIQAHGRHGRAIEDGLEDDPVLSPRNGRMPVAIS